MNRTLGWIDRLRIERVVWALDQRLYDLPRKSRIAKRREVRENLLTAAADIGTSAHCATSATAGSWRSSTAPPNSATSRARPGSRPRSSSSPPSCSSPRS